MQKFSVKTNQKKEVVDITDTVGELIASEGMASGLCHLFVLHTTAAITTADLDPGTDRDYLDAFEEMVPKLKYRHPHDPSHVGDHIMATAIGASLTVPIEKGRVLLGTWQRVVLIEFDGPREREVAVTLRAD